MSFDPEDLDKIKDKIKKDETDTPCNIWGYIRDLERRVQRPYIYEMRGFNGFEENDYGLVVLHTNNTGKVVWRITPNWLGEYKFVLAYASTTAGNVVDLDVRIGSWRFDELMDAERYLPLTSFSVSCTTALVPLKILSGSFIIEQLNEVLIVRLRKTSNSGAGNFYVLGGGLIKQ